MSLPYPTPRKVRLEYISSVSYQDEEIHFYDGSRYLFGFNPAFIPLTRVATFLAQNGYEFPEDLFKR